MKTCIVTGAASGIGLATVPVLLEAGWRVAAFDRDAAALRACSTRWPANLVSWHRVDITDEGAVGSAVAALGDDLSGLVNNAGAAIAKRFVDTTVDDLRRMHEINVVGAFVVARAFVRALQATRRPGAIVNVASTSGRRGHLERSAYGSAKGGVIVLTRVMAVELAADGIRVNAVSPGPVATSLVDVLHTEAMRARWTALVPQHRYAEPREIAEAIAFLLDARRASFITGHVLDVDGGLMAAGLME